MQTDSLLATRHSVLGTRYCFCHGCDHVAVGDVVAVLGRIESTAEGDLRTAFARRIVLRFPGGDVDLAAPSDAEDFGDCIGLDATAGHDLDAVAGVLDEPTNEVEAFGDRVLLAAGEDAGKAEVDELFEGAERVGRDVDGAVKDGLAPAGDVAQDAVALDVDSAVGIEDAEDDAVSSGFEHGASVVLHGRELGFGVAEASAAGAHHGGDGDLEAPPGLNDRADRWGEASEEETGAKLDALATTAFGFDGVVEGTAADFQEDIGHEEMVNRGKRIDD